MRRSDEAEVRAAFAAFDAALEVGDLDEALGWCSDDIVFIGSGEGEEAVGRDALPRMFAALAPLSDGLQFSVAWESVHVEVLGDVAVVLAWGQARIAGRGRDDTLRYRLTGVLVRRGDRWLWRVYHGSEPGAW